MIAALARRGLSLSYPKQMHRRIALRFKYPGLDPAHAVFEPDVECR